MSKEFPSISSLRAFATAARTLSFKDAAASLYISASTLSRQIQSLEEHLEIVLFRRCNPGIEITEAGIRYLATAEGVLTELREARNAFVAESSGPLRVSALESFTRKWLVPNLPDFQKANPGVELELEATFRYADFERDTVDVAIRFGKGPWKGLHSEPIVDLVFFPVCSPILRDGDPPICEPVDLCQHTWIHVAQVPRAWSDWMRWTGNEGLHGKRDLKFDHVGIALMAAETAQGVAISSSILCAAEVADGRLCKPFDLEVPSVLTYHLVCRPEGLDDPRIVAFRDWLVVSLT